MRLMKLIPFPAHLATALGLALLLSAESHAGLIPASTSGPGQHFGPSWNYPSQALPGHRAWGYHRPSPAPWNLKKVLKDYGRRTQSPFNQGNGFGKPDWNFNLPKPGVGHPHPRYPEIDEPETEAEIAECLPDTRFPNSEAPAVPEPDTLALMGAGVLGLLAARAATKGR